MDAALRSDDLAPGDRAIGDRDWSELQVRRVASADDPDFVLGYQRLWEEFGARGEMERPEVIAERLAWDPARPIGRARLAYELLVVRSGERVVAVRDHCAVVRVAASGAPLAGPIVVHLSHALIEPARRGSGIAAWLRSLPLGAARRCAAVAGSAAETPVVLVAEMEPPDTMRPERLRRLRSYQRAGFVKADPAAVPYAQPDFRPAEVLAASAPQAIPLELVMRRVGREHESELPAAELGAIVESIYAVYAPHVPRVALAPLERAAAEWTSRFERFRLLPPLT